MYDDINYVATLMFINKNVVRIALSTSGIILMPFGLPITIKEATDRIHKKEYLLPAIQREFVWSSDQIEMLFDSLMRGYPISSFLFWKVERDNQKNYFS